MINENYIRRQIKFSRHFPQYSCLASYMILKHLKENSSVEGRYFFFSNHGIKTNIKEIQDEETFTGKSDCLIRLGGGLFKDKESISQAFLQCNRKMSPVLFIAYANHMMAAGNDMAWLKFLSAYLNQWGGYNISLSNNASDNILNNLVFENNADKLINQEDKVSIIVPVYNSEKTLSYSVNSLLKQDYRNIEIIIVDDCSTDNSYAICEELASIDKRIILVRNSNNIGTYPTRNNGLSVATGKWVTVHDADDFSLPDRISHQIYSLKYNDANAHLGGYFRINSEGFLTGFRKPGNFSLDGFNHKCLVSLMISMKAMRESLGRWDNVRFGADAELFYRLKKISSIKAIEEWRPLIVALESPMSLTGNNETKLGGPAREMYAKGFLAWHEKSSEGELYLDPENLCRPFEVPEICIKNL